MPTAPPLDKIDTYDAKSGDLNIIIETPKGSRNKFKYDKKQGLIRIYLKYDAKEKSVIQGIQRMSKPGRRVYLRRHEIPKVQGGMGTAIVSTPSGIMTDIEARDEGLGGEYLFRVW